MPSYDLRTSTDFGSTYFIVDTGEKADTLLNKCKRIMDRRWVITDVNNKPIHWCDYIGENLKIPAGTAIATDDPYLTILAKERGIKVLTSLEMASIATGIPTEELKKKWVQNPTPGQLMEAVKKMKEMVADGQINVLPGDPQNDHGEV